jgi:hypothetical protein
MSESLPLVRVCALLERHGAQYVLVGARAAILHGLDRTTQDVDLLVPEDLENHARVIAALSELQDHAAAELTPQDLAENVIVKIADEVEVDVATRAWTITYAEAAPCAERVIIDGVEIIYANLPTLISSKETYRDQDRVDVANLREIWRRRQER